MPSLWRYLPDVLPFGDSLDLPADLVERVNVSTGAEPWFSYAFAARSRRRHICLACRWLARSLPKGATVFEPGCGAGVNLLWIAREGLAAKGSDIVPEALDMCRRMALYSGVPLEVWEDDGVHPRRLPDPVDGILSVNWLYHVPGASMEGFLRAWRPALKPGGVIACDVPDASYNSVKNNQYHTGDAHLPEDQRRPSEYRFRLSRADMERIAAAAGFRVERSALSFSGPLRRGVYLLRRSDEARAASA